MADAVQYPIAQDLTVVQGSRIIVRILYSNANGPVDLRGWTVKSEIRSLGRLILDLTPYWTTGLGVMDLFVPATVTDDLIKGGSWDLLLIPPSGPTQALRMYAGRVLFTKGITDLDGTPPVTA